MGVSRQVTLTLATVAMLAGVLPGFAGYASAKFEALDRAHKEVLRLQAQLTAAKEAAKEATRRATREAEHQARAAEVEVQPVAQEPCVKDKPQDKLKRSAEPPVALTDSWLEPLMPPQDAPESRQGHRRRANPPAGGATNIP
jgi:hypothetical protein